ncbi:ParA family protein, partial [Candidatus Azambacteria bacterium]|nr:ParA family protein [Candidatus Azambacteria bacterium]
TTTAVNTAAFLAEIGKRVLLVDLDPQANATSGVGLYSENISANLYHFLIGHAQANEVILNSGIENFDILPGGKDMAGAAVELINEEGREFKLKNVLAPILDYYDFVIIDCPPSLGILTINGLVAADKVIIPVQCEYYALEGLSQLLETIGLIKENITPNLDIMGAVLTMNDKRNKLSAAVIKEVRRNFPGNVFESIIPRSVSLAEAPSYGKPISHYNSWSKGARAYKASLSAKKEIQRGCFKRSGAINKRAWYFTADSGGGDERGRGEKIPDNSGREKIQSFKARRPKNHPGYHKKRKNGQRAS